MKSTLEMGIRKPLRTPSEGAHSLETQAPGLQQTLLAQHRRDHLLAGLLAGRSIHEEILEEHLGRAGTRSTVFAVVRALDVDGRGRRAADPLEAGGP